MPCPPPPSWPSGSSPHLATALHSWGWALGSSMPLWPLPPSCVFWAPTPVSSGDGGSQRGPAPHLVSPAHAETAGAPASLQRSQSLPHADSGVLGHSAEAASPGSAALSDRDASRLCKFRHLLSGPNTDLGESAHPCQLPGARDILLPASSWHAPWPLSSSGPLTGVCCLR